MNKREAIIQLHCAGRTNSEIIKLLKVAKSNVYHVVTDLWNLVYLKTVKGVEDLALLGKRI